MRTAVEQQEKAALMTYRALMGVNTHAQTDDEL